jgi:hypothetical protein
MSRPARRGKPPAGPEPIAGGPTEAFAVERASASPTLAPTPRRQRERPAARRRSLAPLAPELADAQRWFLDVISHPRSVAAAVGDRALMRRVGADGAAELERIVTRGPRCSAQERLGVYHYAYHARLVDCLADDYPALRYALGEDAFDALARAVIHAHPSDGPNLNVYGRRLAEFCARPRGRVPHRAFARELAALEWAMVEVFHAHAAPTFSPDALRAIPTRRWADARFAPSQTVRLLEFAHPVNRFFQDFREDRQPAIPARGWSATAVYRMGFRIWRMDLTRTTAALLKRLFAGAPLGAALAELGEGDERLAAEVMRWFSEWVSGGFFAALETR